MFMKNIENKPLICFCVLIPTIYSHLLHSNVHTGLRLYGDDYVMFRIHERGMLSAHCKELKKTHLSGRDGKLVHVLVI